jgi:hypothetical protein
MLRLGAIATALASLAGCIPVYRPPSLSEPHATVKVHLAYHVRPGPELDEVVLLNGARANVPAPSEVGWGDVARAVPVRPGSARWDVRATFWHTDTVAETQTTTTQQTVPCADPSMGSCTVPVTDTKTVWVDENVTDAACERAIAHAPEANGVYLLQFDFYGSDRCTLACFRQWPQSDGTFRNGPCEPVPPVAAESGAPVASSR